MFYPEIPFDPTRDFLIRHHIWCESFIHSSLSSQSIHGNSSLFLSSFPPLQMMINTFMLPFIMIIIITMIHFLMSIFVFVSHQPSLSISSDCNLYLCSMWSSPLSLHFLNVCSLVLCSNPNSSVVNGWLTERRTVQSFKGRWRDGVNEKTMTYDMMMRLMMRSQETSTSADLCDFCVSQPSLTDVLPLLHTWSPSHYITHKSPLFCVISTSSV